VVKAAVKFEGEVKSGGKIKLKPGTGNKGGGPPPQKVSLQDMIARICSEFDISDEEALLIRQVTEEKVGDDAIKSTISANCGNVVYLDETLKDQIDGMIQQRYEELGHLNELIEPKYIDTGAIFDLMAHTVIQYHLGNVA